VRSFVGRRPLDHAHFEGTLPVETSGWCVLRASTDGARHPVLDNYIYATTSPIYVTVAGRAPRSPPDARYFKAWIDRIADAVGAYPDWNSAEERTRVQGRLERAQAVFTGLDGSAAP
jgi:hypothetical protein